MVNETWQERINNYELTTLSTYVPHTVASAFYDVRTNTLYVAVLGDIGDYAVYYGDYDETMGLFHNIEYIKDYGNKTYENKHHRLFPEEYKTLKVRR